MNINYLNDVFIEWDCRKTICIIRVNNWIIVEIITSGLQEDHIIFCNVMMIVIYLLETLF